MLYCIVVPKALEDVHEIRVLEWHSRVGQSFTTGDLVVEVETSKAVVEVRAGQPGVLRAIYCDDGTWQALGAPMALVSDTSDEAIPAEPGAVAAMAAEFEVS